MTTSSYRNIFVAEINGRGVVVFNAKSAAVAKQALEEEIAGCDLTNYEDCFGRPLFGDRSNMRIREASPEEVRLSLTHSSRPNGDEHPTSICFLIEVFEPGRAQPAADLIWMKDDLFSVVCALFEEMQLRGWSKDNARSVLAAMAEKDPSLIE